MLVATTYLVAYAMMVHVVSSSPVIRPHPHAKNHILSSPPVVANQLSSSSPTAVDTDKADKEVKEEQVPHSLIVMMNDPPLGFVAPDEMMMAPPFSSHFVGGGLFGDPESQRQPFFHLDYALKY